MTRLLDLVVRRWRDRAAVRAEHCLEPTLHRRVDRLPQRMSDRRRLRADRRRRPGDIGHRIDDASRRAWGRDYLP
jgi:hypothetical protein